MAPGDKSSDTGRQKRRAGHIEEGYEKSGVSNREAERRAWATMNQEEGGRQEERLGARQEAERFRVAQGSAEAARSRSAKRK